MTTPEPEPAPIRLDIRMSADGPDLARRYLAACLADRSAVTLDERRQASRDMAAIERAAERLGYPLNTARIDGAARATLAASDDFRMGKCRYCGRPRTFGGIGVRCGCAGSNDAQARR